MVIFGIGCVWEKGEEKGDEGEGGRDKWERWIWVSEIEGRDERRREGEGEIGGQGVKWDDFGGGGV